MQDDLRRIAFGRADTRPADDPGLLYTWSALEKKYIEQIIPDTSGRTRTL